MTVYDFVRQNRVEIIFNKQGTHECYINYQEGNKPWGVGPNALDALDNGVANYIVQHGGAIDRPGQSQPVNEREENERLRVFLSKEALFIWYFYAKKYDKKKVVAYYENLAQQTHPTYLDTLRFIYAKVNEAVLNSKAKITETYPALNNIFIQALVYHESLAQERYENNKIIADMQNELNPKDKEAFYKIQETIVKVEEEIHKIIE